MSGRMPELDGGSVNGQPMARAKRHADRLMDGYHLKVIVTPLGPAEPGYKIWGDSIKAFADQHGIK